MSKVVLDSEDNIHDATDLDSLDEDYYNEESAAACDEEHNSGDDFDFEDDIVEISSKQQNDIANFYAFKWFFPITRKLESGPEQLTLYLPAKLSPDRRDDDLSLIVSIDLHAMAPIKGVIQVQGDITNARTAEVSQLILAGLTIATHVLREGGKFIVKIFRGKDTSHKYCQLKLFFSVVTFAKPKGSRNSSIKAFAVCENYSPPEGFNPKDLHHLLEKVGTPSGADDLDCSGGWLEGPNKVYIPFLACEDLSGYDSGRSYPLPTIVEGCSYQSLDPVQPPIAPPHSRALEMKKASHGIQELSLILDYYLLSQFVFKDYELKNKECEDTWLSLRELQNELMRESMHVGSLEGQVKEKSRWFSSLSDLTNKFKMLKMEHTRLSAEALEYKKYIKDVTKMTSTIQSASKYIYTYNASDPVLLSLSELEKDHKALMFKFIEGAKERKTVTKNKKNKENRAKLIAPCTLGRTSMPIITCHKLAEERGVTDEEIGRVEPYIPVRTKKDKTIQYPDVIVDIRAMNGEAVYACPKKMGMIILGGGLPKHHIYNANMFCNGADYAIFINTAQEFDGQHDGGYGCAQNIGGGYGCTPPFESLVKVARIRQKRGYKDQWPWGIKIYMDDSGKYQGDAVLSYEDSSAAHSFRGFYNNHDLRGYKINVAIAEKSAPRDPSSIGHGFNEWNVFHPLEKPQKRLRTFSILQLALHV
ncbi:hypothetical protein GIB67_033521 [Kingdonia uniflora]|uniref:Ribosomal RNA methyltransferase FtsJ domain-containing protein n=1 Tax=Kingdonia uniflora TaxID=39325 RepID=A0A7J7L674_9MAGN|nr:hypothetical protein GIB67_033521 [Kingdonia uniflora]